MRATVASGTCSRWRPALPHRDPGPTPWMTCAGQDLPRRSRRQPRPRRRIGAEARIDLEHDPILIGLRVDRADLALARRHRRACRRRRQRTPNWAAAPGRRRYWSPARRPPRSIDVAELGIGASDRRAAGRPRTSRPPDRCRSACTGTGRSGCATRACMSWTGWANVTMPGICDSDASISAAISAALRRRASSGSSTTVREARSASD